MLRTFPCRIVSCITVKRTIPGMGRKGRVLLEALVVFALSISLRCTADAKESEVEAHTGTDVTLPCTVDVGQCGTLHSVKWYRDTSRIYVFSKAGQVSRAEGDATERMTVEYNEEGNEAFLKISKVVVEDEATYKCEITYLDVRENCDVVQIVKLTTLVYPTSVRILGNDGVSISNSTKMEAKDEGSETEVTCEALGGKPVPTIAWYNGSTLISRASYTKHTDSNGVGDASSKLRLTLSRGDLNARYECRVESDATDGPIVSWITFDVHVRPTRMELKGVDDHVFAGETVYLSCNVFGALPAAVAKWYNGTVPITDQHIITTNRDLANDGTYTTRSTLNFTASRWENGKSIYCTAYNEVMKTKHDPDMKDLKIIDVRYTPVITIGSNRTVVREGDRIMLSCTYYANPQDLLDATWRKDGKKLTKVQGKHEFGDRDTPSLHITNISREDMGEYTCWLQNNVGESESEESIFLDVHYPPVVDVIMEPSAPVKAGDRGNVTLECNVTSGNPPALKKVRWLLGGEIMTELPECNYNNQSTSTNESLIGGPFCGIDPSILSLIKVEESFAGNYTCQGENEAGYGPESEPQELVVYYPPTPAKLQYYPLKVIKNFSLTLECTVDHPGRPDNVTYIWYRGNSKLLNATVSNLTIPQASIRTRSNFTCIAKNEGGESAPATVKIEVLAPPAFLPSKLVKDKLSPYKGVLYSSSNISLTCRIECYPLCSIEWLKNDNPIKFERNRNYYKIESNHSADYNKNDFESIESTLVWNMTHQKQLTKGAPNANYTCRSISNLGNKINFTTEIAVDYPPEEIQVTKKQIDVKENEMPDNVVCSGSGHPKLTYAWKKSGSTEHISKSQTLELPKLTKKDDGNYICEASNRYGIGTATVRFNVLYKPECSIDLRDRDGSPALVCGAKANPQNVTFAWKIRESNNTVDFDDVTNEGLNSFLILDSSVDTYRTYLCIATNLVGSSVPCERYVPAYQEQSSQIGEPSGMVPWYKRLGDNLIIVIAAVVIIIVCVIIVCIIIILLCRRKRLNTKCNNPLELEEREKPDGQSPDSTSGRPKWPLKPGVLVHSSKIHGVNISQLGPDAVPFKPVRDKKTSTLLKYRRNKSKVYARLQRISDFLGLSGRDRVPSGITVSASGVVTYKKIKPTSPPPDVYNNNSRKRKKPGYYPPNPSSTGDKMRSGAAPPVGGSADPTAHNDPNKGFYENLPFHGMQNPPNKPISVIAPFTQDKPQKILIPAGKLVQRHQSFHGFQANNNLAAFNFNRNFSNPYLNRAQYFNNNPFLNHGFNNGAFFVPPPPPSYRFNTDNRPGGNFRQPLLNFNPFWYPNPFSVPPRVAGRRESDIRRTASGINLNSSKQPDLNKTFPQSRIISVDESKKFGSLELKKHKCYSPTFYSMRCKKHAKKRPIIYALPKKVLLKEDGEVKNVETYQDLTDSIQIFEQSSDNTESRETAEIPVPAPRCKKHREIIYQNVAKHLKLNKDDDSSKSSNDDGSEILDSEVSVIEAQVHNAKDINDSKNEATILESNQKFTPRLVGASPKALKNSPTLKVSPNFVKPKTDSPKGALSLQIQAKMTKSQDNLNQNDDNPKENLLPLIPQMPLLHPQTKWSPSNNALANHNNNQRQNAFYTLTTPHYKHFNAGLPPQYSATVPHQKHVKLLPRALFNNAEQLPKSKSFSSKSKHKKHFQIPLQKCHSFKFQTAESYFQPIKNIHEEDLMKNGYVSDYPDGSRSHLVYHNKIREKPKQKTKGPLVLKRPGDCQFQEGMHNSVQLQYPQPLIGRNPNSATSKPNGVVYADLDMPKTNKAKAAHESSSQNKSQKSSNKPKTEYATLTFNDIGQEIDV